MNAAVLATYVLLFPTITLIILLVLWVQIWRDAKREKKDVV